MMSDCAAFVLLPLLFSQINADRHCTLGLSEKQTEEEGAVNDTHLYDLDSI